MSLKLSITGALLMVAGGALGDNCCCGGPPPDPAPCDCNAVVLTCYQIQGYDETLWPIWPTCSDCEESDQPWDGIFNSTCSFCCVEEDLEFKSINGNRVTERVYLVLNQDDPEACFWEIRLGCLDGSWRYQKLTGATPDGIYTRYESPSSCPDSGPETLTIIPC